MTNSIAMACEFWDQPQNWVKLLYAFDVTFVIVFTIEAILKIIAKGFNLYITSNWNTFYCIIVIVAWIGIIVIGVDIGYNIVRLFRVGRILTLVNKAKTLKLLFWTLVYSIP